MNKYRKQVKEEADAFLKEINEPFSADGNENGGKSERPNLALWLDKNGLLAQYVEKKAEKWGKKDLLWINENSRNNTPYGDPRDSAYRAYYKDMLFELKKLMKKV